MEENEEHSCIRYIRGLGLISSDSAHAKTYYHYVSDEQGSITYLIRGEEKDVLPQLPEGEKESEDKVLNHYTYDAFGNMQACEETVSNRFRYNGEQYDALTNQYYLRARFYNPVIVRFTHEDTYYGDGLNLYQYCANHPVGYGDPSGHAVCETQRNLYQQYRQEGLNSYEAFKRMREDLGLPVNTPDPNGGSFTNLTDKELSRLRQKAVREAWKMEKELVQKNRSGKSKLDFRRN